MVDRLTPADELRGLRARVQVLEAELEEAWRYRSQLIRELIAKDKRTEARIAYWSSACAECVYRIKEPA